MPLPFGVGELTARVRRALDVRGRIPFMLDEVVVPVAQVISTTGAPYRSDGIAWSVADSSAGFAGALASIGVVAELAGTSVVDQVVIGNTNAGPILYALFIQGSVYATPDAKSTERPAALIQGPNIPVDIVITNQGAGPLNATIVRLGLFMLPAATTLVVPVDILLTGELSPGVNPGLHVAALTDGAAIAASFFGHYFAPNTNPT